MTQADSVYITPPTPTSAIGDPQPAYRDLHLLHRAGMRLQHIGGDRYEIRWRNQTVASGLTLLAAAKFIDRALNREARS